MANRQKFSNAGAKFGTPPRSWCKEIGRCAKQIAYIRLQFVFEHDSTTLCKWNDISFKQCGVPAKRSVIVQ